MSDTILVVAEHRDGAISDVTGEAVAVGATLADSVELVLIAESPDELIEDLSYAPVDTIHTYEYPELFNHDAYAGAITRLAAKRDVSAIVAGQTVNGMDYVPAVAERLDWPLLTDAIDIDRGGAGFRVTGEAYGSKVETTLEISSTPAVISLRPGEWEQSDTGGDPEVNVLDISIPPEEIKTEVSGIEAVAGGAVDITDADVLVSIGRGIGEEENIELIERLADALDATISASRPIVDAGWLPPDRQVGQSGKTVTPEVYLAIGISGAVQHVAGMKGAETIIAINDDPNAPIFEIADVGIVDDLFEVVPALIEELSA